VALGFEVQSPTLLTLKPYTALRRLGQSSTSMDASTTAAAAPPPRNDEPDSRASLRHILAADSNMEESKTPPPQTNTPGPEDSEATQEATASKVASDADANKPFYTATTTTTRRNANGSVSSVYSGNKIRHLKKDDGIPLWRKDIQYDFLRYVFEDDQRVFHKYSEKDAGRAEHTFADIYLDAMANSSKCSKILKDKLLTERPAAINMAMVCLLVNVGRMNTTLNCTSISRSIIESF
jgi:Ino eighty subunit 1